ncbi:MAG: AraC family transcriptional regulator [Pseudomonadota bacterium]
MSLFMGQSSVKQPTVAAARLDAPAGGGAFQIDRLSIGVFLVDQPTHRIAVGGDKRIDRPMAVHEGWILPAGVSGVCEFDDDHTFVSVEVDDALLQDAGFDPRQAFAPQFGAHDPLLLQMALAAATPASGAPTLYLETMRQALAAHVAQIVQPLSETSAQIDDARLRRAVDYIHDNLASDLSLERLAMEAAMSPFHFSRAFKKATGRSPLQFVIAERLALARVLLRTTALPVAEIAHRVGYEDVSRFGQHFKRQFGATPGSLRR